MVVGSYDTAEFVIGRDDFTRLYIRKSGIKGFHYFYDVNRGLIKNFVLDEKPRVITLCEVALIKKGDKFSPRLRFWKQNQQTGNQAIERASTAEFVDIKAGVSLDECHENFWRLINFLQELRSIEAPVESFSLVGTPDRAFVNKVLFSFNTPEARRLLIDAKKDDVKNLYAAVRQAKNKQALDELQALIVGDAPELKFQAWFENNTWAFGIEYLQIYKTSRIGIHSDSDFIARSLDQYADLIELKRPRMSLLNHDSSHNSYYPSSDLSKAIGQAVKYLYTMENNRTELGEEDGITVLKPRVKIVAGLTESFDSAQKRTLRLINSSLHGIEIISYDQVVSRAQKLIDIFSPVVDDQG